MIGKYAFAFGFELNLFFELLNKKYRKIFCRNKKLCIFALALKTKVIKARSSIG
jgi:hypothetical protein